MKSLFNPADNAEMIQRISKLTPGSSPQWGKMQVSHMMAHCNAALQSAFGDVKLKRSILGMLVGPMAKKKLLGPKGFSRNLPTDKHFIIHDHRDFSEEKTKLTALVQRFVEKGTSALSSEPHPFFGNLTTEEWDALMWKHLDHHLAQFGE